MADSVSVRLPEIVKANQVELLREWVALQVSESASKRRGLDERQVQETSREFLGAFAEAAGSASGASIYGEDWSSVRLLLDQITQLRVNQGFTPTEVATFVFSFKEPLFKKLQKAFGTNVEELSRETWNANTLIDSLGLYTTEVYQKTRNEVILRQQEEMMELSTPVVQLWDGVLALPIIGTLDSARTQVVMQNLLQAIVDTGAEIAIIDITGVPTVDTLVAQHLLKTVAAARLMGADCIISGIRPQIAQTIIHLGVDLTNVATKATLADAFAMALKKSGARIVRTSPADKLEV